MSLPCTEIRLETPWGALAAKAWGPETGERILALHGWLDNAATFDRLVPLLRRDWRIVALDFAGHGLSDHRPPGTIYHLIDAIPDTLHALEALGWSQCSLIGHSLGGGVATLLAGTLPEKFHKVVLLEALGPMTAEAADLPQRVAQFLSDWAQLKEKRLPLYRSLDEAVLARLSVGGLTRTAAETLASRGTRPVGGGFTWRSDPRLRIASPLRLSEDQLAAFLRRIQCPTLVLRAEQGIAIDEAVWKKRASLVRSLTWTRVAGGHHVHLDSPETVAPLITEFLAA